MTAKPDGGFVVVTGTSTGIGAATAAHLTKQGFHVFAGVRQKATERRCALKLQTG